MTKDEQRKQRLANFTTKVGDRNNLEYDFETEVEMVKLCQCGEMIHMDCERCRPQEMPNDSQCA